MFWSCTLDYARSLSSFPCMFISINDVGIIRDRTAGSDPMKNPSFLLVNAVICSCHIMSATMHVVVHTAFELIPPMTMITLRVFGSLPFLWYLSYREGGAKKLDLASGGKTFAGCALIGCNLILLNQLLMMINQLHHFQHLH